MSLLSRATFSALTAAASLLFAGAGGGQNADKLPGVSVPAEPPREWLSETGLYVSGSQFVRPENLSFTPQYPLWSDGATKQRWFNLPSGTAIDAARPDAWEFPRGARFWKQFSHRRAVETRLIERLADGSWRYVAYVWEADGRDARLAPAAGIRNLSADGAPDGRYVIPSQEDCRACHEGAAVPVLGVSALQLSPDRDPNAPNAEDARQGDINLFALARYGLLRNAAAQLLATPPRIQAASPTARAALGYLHANCGHCHNASGPLADLDFVLAQSSISDPARPATAHHATLDYAAETPLLGLGRRLVPGYPDQSLLAARMRSRNPFIQMPPLGTRMADTRGLFVVDEWIAKLPSREETKQ